MRVAITNTRLSIDTLVKTIFIVCLGWYLFHDFIKGNWVFAHPDTRDLYFYFRKYALDSILSGYFPFWNYDLGIGAPNLVWGHFPFDIFTPLEILIGFDETTYFIEALVRWGVIFSALFLILRHFKVTRQVSILLSALYLLTPCVSHYIIQGYVSLGIGLTLMSTWAIIKFAQSGRRIWLLSSAILLAFSLLGYKVEFWPFSFWLVAFFPFLTFALLREPSHIKLTLGSKILGLSFPALFAVSINLALFWAYGQILEDSERVSALGNILNFFDLSIHIKFLKYLLASPASAPLSALILAWILKNYGFTKNQLVLFSGIIFICVLSLSLAINADRYIFSKKCWQTLLTLITITITFVLIQRSRRKRKIEILTDLTNGFIRFWIFFYIFNSLTIPTEFVEYDLFPEILKQPMLGTIFAGLLWFPNTRPLRYAVFGGIAFVLTREALQTYFIQVLGFIWHPKRDEFIFQFFCIIAFGGSLRCFATVLRRSQSFVRSRLAIRFLPMLFTLALVISAKQYLMRFDASIWNLPDEIETKESIVREISSAIFGEKNKWPVAENPGIFAIPPKYWRAEDPWTSDFPLNPGVFLLGGIRDLRHYNSVTPKYYSGLFGFVSYGKSNVFGGPIVNHTFPEFITAHVNNALHQADHKQLELGQTSALGNYESLRSELLTLNSNILRILGANAVVTTEPITKYLATDSLYFTRPSDLENLEPIGSRRYPHSPYEYFLYRITDREPFIRPIDSLICINDGYASEISEVISIEKKLPNQVIVNCKKLPYDWVVRPWSKAKIDVRKVERGYAGIKLEIDANKDTLVAVRNQFTKSMDATLDNAPIDGYRADLIQSLYFIPKGTHTLEISVFSSIVGKKILVISCLLVVILMITLTFTGRTLISSK